MLEAIRNLFEGLKDMPQGILELPPAMKSLVLLLSVPGLYCLMVVGGRQLKRKHGVRLGWTYHLFGISLAVYVPMLLLGMAGHRQEIAAITVVSGAMFLIALVDRYIWEVYFRERHKVEVPKFLTEVGRILILLLAAFLVLMFFYDKSFKELLIAPGIAAVVIGLAMQDLVGNIIAGMSIQVGKPFVQGDWLNLNDRFAKVVEINWRGTRLVTTDDLCIEIPHREMAGKTIINLNRPTKQHAMRVTVGIDYSAAPTRVKDVLLHAVSNAKGISAEPKPKVYLKNFGDFAIEYEIKFWLEDQGQYNDVCDSIRTNVWYSLRRHGIKIPFPTRTVQLERPGRTREQQVQSTARIMLAQQPIFKCLTDAQLDALLPRGRVIHFGRNEKIIEQGAAGDSMFILVDGEANVVVDRKGFQTHVASLKSGDCFGELSLLTGENRSATVLANKDCEVVEIGKAVLGHSLRENPELLHKLSELLAHRQLQNEGIFAAQVQEQDFKEKQTEYQTSFAHKLRTFFEL